MTGMKRRFVPSLWQNSRDKNSYPAFRIAGRIERPDTVENNAPPGKVLLNLEIPLP